MDFQVNGHARNCPPDDLQYEIASDKTDHVAHYKGDALTRID